MLFCLWKSKSLVLGIIYLFFPFHQHQRLLSALLWHGFDVLSVGNQFTALELSGSGWIPGENVALSVQLRELSQEAPGKTVWSCYVIVIRSNISSLLYFSTCRKRFVNNPIFGNEEFVVRSDGEMVSILAIWAKLRGLWAAIRQAIKSQEDRRVKCQPVNLLEEDGWNYQ